MSRSHNRTQQSLNIETFGKNKLNHTNKVKEVRMSSAILFAFLLPVLRLGLIFGHRHHNVGDENHIGHDGGQCSCIC